MAAPDDTETQAPPDYSGASPEIKAALANVGGGSAPLDYGTLAQQLLQQPTLPQPDTTPVTRGLLSRIGEALGGGNVSGVMSPAQQEMAGLRSLRDFGTSLIAGSGYYPGKPALGAFAEGFQGAERSQRGSEQQAAATLAAQQQYAAGQQQQYLERLKTALPLLQMERAGAVPNVLASGPAVPGTATGAGGPANAVPAPLTPFIAKNLPAGVTPAEDQMVRTVIGEAGGEPLTGQQGVAAVIKNRMNLGKQDAQSVIFAPNQFEPWNNPATRAKLEGLDPSSQQYQEVLNKAVRPVMSGDAQDPTGGATNFYAPKLMPGGGPSWAANQQPSATIGGHQFYKLPYGAPPTAQVAGPGAPTGGPASSPGPITPAPTETPPAASTAPAGTPPAPDTRPDDALTWEEFQARHGTPITAASRPDLVVPVDQQSATELQSSMAQAKHDVDYALTPADKTKAQAQYTDASAKLAQLRQDAAAKTAANVLAAQKQQGELLSPLYQEAKKQAAQVTEADKQRQGAINLENVKSGNQVNAKFQDDLNTDMKNMGTRVDDLQLLRGLSDNVGTATPLTSIKFGGRSLADIISTTGFGGQNLQNKAAAVQAFRAGVLNVVRDLRAGGAATGEPRSNQDLQFVMDMAPSEWEDPNTRSAIISYLQQVGQRRFDLAAEATRQMTTTLPNGRPMPGGLAYEAARAKLPDMVPQLPTEGLGPGPDQLAARTKFFAGVKPYTFFRYPNGRMDLYKGMPQQGQR